MSATREFQERLRRRAREEDVALSSDLCVQIEGYYRLLSKWNAKVNLTALNLPPGGEDQAMDRLLIEPLIAARHLPARSTVVLDAGSGGGSPAIPLKLAAPHLSLRMVESKTRKSAFLREAVRTLALTHTVVETVRVEELLARPDMHESADVVTVRAVRLEPTLLQTLQAFVRPSGHLLLFRGPEGGAAESVMPPLFWEATFPLVRSLRSRLVVLTKPPVGRG